MNALIILDYLVVLQLLDVAAVVHSDTEDGAEQHREPAEGKSGHVPKPREDKDVAAYDFDFDAFLVEEHSQVSLFLVKGTVEIHFDWDWGQAHTNYEVRFPSMNTLVKFKYTTESLRLDGYIEMLKNWILWVRFIHGH